MIFAPDETDAGNGAKRGTKPVRMHRMKGKENGAGFDRQNTEAKSTTRWKWNGVEAGEAAADTCTCQSPGQWIDMRIMIIPDWGD